MLISPWLNVDGELIKLYDADELLYHTERYGMSLHIYSKTSVKQF